MVFRKLQLPCAHLTACLTGTQPIGIIAPVSSATEMNSAGEEATRWVLPAHKSFKTNDPAGFQQHNRLVVNQTPDNRPPWAGL